jgi:hypothetical protein
MKRHTALNRAFTNVLDSNGTLTQQSLSKAHREPLRGVARGVLVAIGIALCIMPNAGGSKPVQYVTHKEYALHLLGYNLKEYKCLAVLYGKESAWNPNARNGSHYGIPQGRSIYLSTLNGYEQIQWGLDYISNRYGEPCIALDHWRKYNWH